MVSDDGPGESPFVGCVEGTPDGDGEVRVSGLFDPERSARCASHLLPGSVVEVGGQEPRLLAEPGSALAQIYELLAAHGLDPVPTPEVMDDVTRVLAAPGLDDGVTDRTDVPFVTIDNEGSRDLDQALHIAPLAGGYRVCYALADAFYYVRPDTPLFEEALARGSSFYVPGVTVPMLPVALSEGLVSLNPRVDRRAMVFVMDLEPDGRIRQTRVARWRVRSRAKLTYDGVQTFLDDSVGSALGNRSFTQSLRLLREVGRARLRLARRRGVIEYDRGEPEISASPRAGTGFRVRARHRLEVERWNAQISLLCNMEGARLLDRLGRLDAEVQAVFRVHLPPLAERLKELETVITDVVRRHQLGASWSWERGQDLATYLAHLPRDRRWWRIRAAIDRQVRYANRASAFTDVAAPHHALAVDRYARFSSPMREIVGIFTHKELLEGLGSEPPRDREADEELRRQVISSGNRAKQLQRQLDKEVSLLAIGQLLRADLDRPAARRPSRLGTVVGLRASRLYVALDAFPIDLKVYARDLAARHGCAYHRRGAALEPEAGGAAAPAFRVGDAVRLVTRDYDPARRRFSFDVEVGER